MPLIPTQYLDKPKNNEVEITLFGNGYGESIVIYIPEVGWGIIDSFQTEIEGRTIIPPLEYLKELLYPDYPRLAFILLTHPHEDHYLGFDNILRDYPGGIEKIYWYQGDGIRELKVYWLQQKIANNGVLPNYSRIHEAIRKAIKQGVTERRLSELTEVVDKRHIKIDNYGYTDISIKALSPGASAERKYVELLHKAITDIKQGKPVFQLNDHSHNLLSVALYITLGDLKILLGSDVENTHGDDTAWQGILHNTGVNLSAQLVKVSHHGSKNGYYKKAWDMHCEDTKPIAIIAPYNRTSSALPNSALINELKGKCKNVGVSGTVEESKTLTKHYKRNVATAIKYTTRSFRVLTKPKSVGFIRNRFLLSGTVQESVAIAPAKWL
jgi:hypothetical protein